MEYTEFQLEIDYILYMSDPNYHCDVNRLLLCELCEGIKNIICLFKIKKYYHIQVLKIFTLF